MQGLKRLTLLYLVALSPNVFAEAALAPDSGNTYPDTNNNVPPFRPDADPIDTGWRVDSGLFGEGGVPDTGWDIDTGPPGFGEGGVPDTGWYIDTGRPGHGEGGVPDTGPDPVDTGPDSVDAGYPDDGSSNEETGEIETVDTVGCNCAISNPRASSSLGLLLLSALLLRRRRRI